MEGHAHPVHRPALHRLHPGKTEVRIYDYVDRAVPMLLKVFEKRLRGYRAIGYARDEAPLGLREIEDEAVVEHDEEVPRGLEIVNSEQARRITMNIAGKWRITEMEVWDRDAIDLVGPAFIEFAGQGGQFRFIAVDGWMDCRHKDKNGQPCVEFTWNGNDECDPASGRGWARLEKDGSLTGRIYIHHGDDSAFKATPFVEEPEPVALSNFESAKRCFERAGLGAEWQKTVSQVRADHHRKTGFIPGFERLVAGSGRSADPSFLERAKARWSGRQRSK